MLIRFKSYRLQGLECDKQGNRVEIPCIKCGQINLVCIKFKAYCRSGLCREERKQIKTSCKNRGSPAVIGSSYWDEPNKNL